MYRDSPKNIAISLKTIASSHSFAMANKILFIYIIPSKHGRHNNYLLIANRIASLYSRQKFRHVFFTANAQYPTAHSKGGADSHCIVESAPPRLYIKEGIWNMSIEDVRLAVAGDIYVV